MSKKIGVYPGTFDPVTLGHLAAFDDSLALFDEVYVLMANNDDKLGRVMFTTDENKSLMVKSFESIPSLFKAYSDGRLKIATYAGMTVDFAISVNANFIIRGLRSLTDFDYEQQMNHVNRRFAPTIRTWFIMSDEKYQLVSSTYAKNIIRGGKDGSWLVLPHVEDAIRAKAGLPPIDRSIAA